MAAVPVLKPREAIAVLTSLGFEEVRQRGSHEHFRHTDGRGTTAPVHGGRDLSPVLLRRIACDVGLTVHQFAAHRR
ncbi:MAG: type II toxin-antitoxin system HicA family toxin [bacterium]|nr:type II toxin-antitoxin system HicA family toxin [bacterium]